MLCFLAAWNAWNPAIQPTKDRVQIAPCGFGIHHGKRFT
jgi:hypothetical protein